MRRLFLAALAVVAAAAVASCGSSSQSAASSPTLQALSYFPSSTPFVLTFATDPKSPGIRELHALEQRFPQATLVQTALFARLGQLGVDYDKDIRPLFGNPVALGAVSSQVVGSNPPVVIAWVTRSQSALDALVNEVGAGLQSAGTHDGAKLYLVGGEVVAIDGPTILLSHSAQDIDAALDRHKSDQGFGAAKYAELIAGVHGGGLIQMVGDLTGVLSTPNSTRARHIPWVAAIKGYGASVDINQSGLTIQYHVDTTGRPLSSSQLPLAAGSASPGLAGNLPIQAGLRDLTQPIQFAEAAASATDPAQYARFTARLAKLKRRSGFDLNALVGMLTGDLDVSSDTHTTVACVVVSDPAAVTAMVAELARAPAVAFKRGTSIHPLGGGLYDVKERHLTLTMGVIGNQLLLGRANPAQLRAYAHAARSPLPGAAGSATFRVALPTLLHLALKRAPSPVAQQFLNLLGDVTGSATDTPSGLNGSATLALK